MEQLSLYVDESVARTGRKVTRRSVYLGLAVLLAAASLVAVNARGGASTKFPRVLVPGRAAHARRRRTALSSHKPSTARR